MIRNRHLTGPRQGFFALVLLPLVVLVIALIGQWTATTQAAGPFDEIMAISPDAVAGDNFGYAVAVDGNTLVVGAYWTDLDEMEKAGAAYVFTRPSADALQWTQVARLTADDGEAFDQFGAAVAVDGDTVVVGQTSQT